ncbi:YihY/virulence factor BrkB family protein [Deinococcus lacus]|uniref:YihY/virulence factor BrkB family protein n=1 Tax=Deinococcus lacus TaxID=392561 RepID=A0ABW1YEB5_9DEIO
MLPFSAVLKLLQEAFGAFNRDNAPRMAAALTFFSLFALAPLLVLAIAVSSSLLADNTVQERLISFITQNLTSSANPEAAQQTAGQLRELLSASQAKLKDSVPLTYLLGFATLFWASTNLFVQLRGALNDLWHVPDDQEGGFLGMLVARAKGFAMIIGFGLLIVAFFGVNTYFSAAAQTLGEQIGVGVLLVRLVAAALGVILMTGVFAMIYRVLPNVQLQWKDVTIGAFVTAVLFIAAQVALSWYFANFLASSPFGAASSLILLLLWINYNSMILFFGAELTYAYAKHYGSSEAAISALNKDDGYLSEREARAIAYATERGARLAPQERPRAWNRREQPEQPTMLTVTQKPPGRCCLAWAEQSGTR